MPIEVSPRYQTEQYTGDEVAFLAAIGGVLVDVEGDQLRFTLFDMPHSIASGQWLVWISTGTVNMVTDTLSTAEREARYIAVPAG